MHSQANPPQSPGVWSSHEHVASPVELEAKKLLAAAGSSEIAKHAIDLASGLDSSSSDQGEALAEAIGFRTYRALLESSTLGPNIGDRQWYATSICANEWILWNDRDHAVVGVFESSNEAFAAAS